MTDLDPQQVRALLHELPHYYPGAEDWIDRRVADVNAGRALAVTATTAQGQLVGICLGTGRDNGRFKISTLFVAEGFRGAGRGSKLLHAVLARTGGAEVYITAAATLRTKVGPLLVANGFWPTATVPDRYGPGRTEDVYVRAGR